MSKMKKTREHAATPLQSDLDSFEQAARLSVAFLSARDNFSRDTASPIQLSGRVCALLQSTETALLRALHGPPAPGRYHMIHIQTTPDTVLKDEYNFSASYDTIIPRKHLHFDIYRSVQKLNAAEALIRKDGLKVTTSLQEAHLLILLSYLKQKPISYETYFNSEAIVPGPHPEIPDEKIWIDNGNPFYERFGNPPTLPSWPTPLTPVTTSPQPTIVRLINEDYVIQAFKMLTENLTMFLVEGGEDGVQGRIAIAQFEDRVGVNGDLEFGTKVSYLPKLPKRKAEGFKAGGPVAKAVKTGSRKTDSVVGSGEENERGKKRQRKK